MPDISLIAMIGAAPMSGVVCSAYKASRFGSLPVAYDTAAPGGAADATETSGTAFGGPGRVVLTVPTFEEYWIAVPSGGHIAWVESPAPLVHLVDGGHVAILAPPSGGDDAATIAAAIATVVAACQADGTNVCGVQFQAGIYQATRALQRQTLASGVTNNTQIPLPWVPKTAQKVVVNIIGVAPAGIFPMYGQSVKQSEGTVLQTTLVPSAMDANGIPSIIGGPSVVPNTVTFSNLDVVVRNMTFRAPDNPGMAGLDCSYVGHIDWDELRADTDVIQGAALYGGGTPTAIALPTKPTGQAFITPQQSNNSVQRIGKITVLGWYQGLAFNEHVQVDSLVAVKCFVALGPNNGVIHPSLIAYVSAEHCPYTVAYVDPYSGVAAVPTSILGGDAEFDIALLDIEDKASAPWLAKAHIYDPLSQFHGKARFFRGVEDVGPASGLLVCGGGNFITEDMRAARSTGFIAPGNVPGAAFWLDPASVTVADGAAMSTWAEKVAGLNASQATGANQPTYRATGIGGKPAVEFNGTSTFMTTTRTASGLPFTVAYVITFTDFTSYHSPMGSNEGSGGIAFRPGAPGDSPGKVQLMDEQRALIATSDNALTAGTAYVFVGTYDTLGNYAFWVNGAKDGAGYYLDWITAGRTRRIGSGYGGDFHLGKLGDYLEFDRVLAMQERNALTMALATKYGITLS